MTRRRRNFFEPKWVFVFVFFAAGVFGGGLATYLWTNAAASKTIKLHFPKGTYTYANPTLISDTVGSNTGSKDLELELDGLIAKDKKNGIRQAGLYYRDLEPAKWIDINSSLQFSPGILLKIPIMVAYYRLAQQNKDILNQRLIYDGRTYPTGAALFEQAPAVEKGNRYSVEELVQKMIVNYDDTATNILFNYVDKNVLNETYSDLGIDVIEDNVAPDFISIRRYSLFFRALYNATYLGPEYSEKALALLAENRSHSFLEQQLPQSISFVSRAGGRRLPSGGVEIYECDIVYYPGSHDYLLCAAAQGDTVEHVKNLLSRIGAAVYQETAYTYDS